MNRLQLIQRVRANTRDFSNSIFREQDIIDYINEGINRIKQVIPQLKSVPLLMANTQNVLLIPEYYQHLIAVYASARCFAQDERSYQATTLMNEFEVKLEELRTNIENGIVVILDENGEPVDIGINDIDYVDVESYFGKRYKEEW